MHETKDDCEEDTRVNQSTDNRGSSVDGNRDDGPQDGLNNFVQEW